MIVLVAPGDEPPGWKIRWPPPVGSVTCAVRVDCPGARSVATLRNATVTPSSDPRRRGAPVRHAVRGVRGRPSGRGHELGVGAARTGTATARRVRTETIEGAAEPRGMNRSLPSVT